MYEDLSKNKFGKLTPIKRVQDKVYKNKRKKSQWLCKCDCGNEKITTAEFLKSGRVKSCGCLKKEIKNDHSIKHGMTNTRLYKIWSGMIDRCTNPKHTHYYRYGGRGILICSKWLNKFEYFYDWAISNGYNDNLTLDRMDNNKNYEPNNCRWSTRKEQQNNTSSNIILSHNGENKTLAEWCDIFCKNIRERSRAYWRNKRGFSFEELFSPLKSKIAKKQSGVKGIRWQEKQEEWSVWGIKDGKKNQYLKTFKDLNDAIVFKEEYDKNKNGS